MKASTRNDYQRRLTAVVEYIYEHLDSDLDVNTLAEIAWMSPYHFHRIYREIAQETVNNTVRRLRLQRVAIELIRSNDSLASIASSVRYGSVEALSRAFLKQFGLPPMEYRQAKQAKPPALEPFVSLFPIQQKRYDTMFDVTIEEHPSKQLIGYHHQGDYMEIGKVFEKLFIYANAQKILTEETRSIGLYYDDPKSVEIQQLRSMACITGDAKHANDDKDLEAITVPAGRVATILFKGPYPELDKPYDWLFGEWLPNSGYEAADFPAFDEYLNDPKDTPPSELLTKIYCLLK